MTFLPALLSSVGRLGAVPARSIALALALVAAPAALAGVTLSGKPKVAFYAVGNPGVLDIEGVADEVRVSDDGTTITVTVPMDSVHTGIDLRDHHMNEKYVETGKFPDVTLAVPRASLTWPASVGEAATGTIDAPFTAHGVTKDVSVSYDLRKTKTGWRVRAKFPFNAGDYGISIPAYLGITVDPAMRVEASLDLTEG